MAEFKELIGKTLKSIHANVGDDLISANEAAA